MSMTEESASYCVGESVDKCGETSAPFALTGWVGSGDMANNYHILIEVFSRVKFTSNPFQLLPGVCGILEHVKVHCIGCWGENCNDFQIALCIIRRIESCCLNLLNLSFTQKFCPIVPSCSFQIITRSTVEVVFINRTIFMVSEHRIDGGVIEILFQIATH